jgi:MFS transporter, DHA1 family, tetracycline resistance protein
MIKNKQLAAIFLIVFIDLLGFSLILPLLPYYAQSYGASPVVTGILVASYAAAQLIGAPILGRLSDRFGRRPILLVSIVGTVIGFVLLGMAKTLALLFAARILDGVTGGNLSIAQAYISDVTDSKNRARSLGMIGAAFGLGFIIGPATGGFLSQWGYNVPAYSAAGLATLNLILVYFWLPESLSIERRIEIQSSPKTSFTLRAMLEALQRPYVGNLLHTRFFYGLAFSLFQTIFALYMEYKFNFQAKGTGYILAYVGILSVIVQGFVIGRLAKHFSENRLILIGTVIMAASLAGWAFVPSIPALMVILIFTAFSGGVLNTMINSALTKSVLPEEVGGALGLAASLESFTRVISPALGGWALEKLGTWAPGLVGAVIMAWLAWYVWRYIYPATKALPVPIKTIPSGENV